MGAREMQQGSGQHRSQEVVEGISVRLEPAPILQRTLAAFIDYGIIGAITYAVTIPLVFFVAIFVGIGAGIAKDSLATWTSLGIVGIVFLVLYVLAALIGAHYYFIHYEFTKGATPGKKLMGLKVVSVDGNRLTKGQAVYREIVKSYLDVIFFIPAAVSMALTKRRQRVGDVLAGTMVVHSRVREQGQQSIYVKQEDYLAIKAHLQLPEIPRDVRSSYLIAANRAYLENEQYQLAGELAQWSAYFRGLLGGQAERLELNDTTVLRFMAEHCFQLDLLERE